jgi:hypothetical protein
VQEGDLDNMRVLIEAFLTVVERVLPEQFFEKVTAQRTFAKQFFSSTNPPTFAGARGKFAR